MRATRTAGTGLFLHLSDGALYAPGPTPERPAREDEPLDAGDDAALGAKLEEERILQGLGLPAVCLRVFDVVGPMFPPRRFPVEALEAILSGEEAFYEESGWRDFIHIEDVVSGALLAMKKRTIGRTFNLGGGLLVNPRTFLALLARQAGRELNLTVLPPAGKLRPRRVGNLAAARELLGWAPVYTVSDIAGSLVKARLGTGGAREAPSARTRAREPVTPVSRRDLFNLFRRPFRGRGR
jgi:dTDP-L-rhamnose 4-epimerase